MNAGKIIIADDEKNIREGLAEALTTEGYTVIKAADGEEALRSLEKEAVDVVVADLKMPKISGDQLLQEITSRFPSTQTIILTAHGDVTHAVETLANGAFSYLTKPPRLRELILKCAQAIAKSRLINENEHLNTQKQQEERDTLGRMIGKSTVMEKVFDQIRMVAATNASVLITGENGTGKEKVAHAIHSLSHIWKKPMVIVHCAALNDNLLESELFGHEKGSFTGATHRRQGRFESAHNSTLFLDEIGEIPISTQVKLLRVLQERHFERVGGGETISSQFRLICATNRNLEKMVKENSFREDLYYRLAVVRVSLPSLSERTEDIPFLVSSFLKEFSEDNLRRVTSISAQALEALKAYHWPGNIRELRNVIESLVVMTRKERIEYGDLPESVLHALSGNASTDSNNTSFSGKTLAEAEEILVKRALKQQDGNKTHAAKALGISRKTLQRKILEFSEIESKLSHEDAGEVHDL